MHTYYDPVERIFHAEHDVWPEFEIGFCMMAAGGATDAVAL